MIQTEAAVPGWNPRPLTRPRPPAVNVTRPPAEALVPVSSAPKVVEPARTLDGPVVSTGAADVAPSASMTTAAPASSSRTLPSLGTVGVPGVTSMVVDEEDGVVVDVDGTTVDEVVVDDGSTDDEVVDEGGTYVVVDVDGGT